ncbi:MAG: site-2 protease family protein [Novosphingobium sp.]|nr:site-2 protease family protein [Novosphingobium sp.]
MNETLLNALALIPALIVAIVFHEVSHGLVARMLGDPTAAEQKRLSLNPLRHVDPIGTVVLPGMLALVKAPIFGWAKPVPVDKWRLRNPRYGMMAVAAAGPGSNFVLAGVGAIVLGLMARFISGAPDDGLMLLAMALNYFIVINVFLALFNLLPIPPFDGSHIVEGLLPRNMARQYVKLRPYGFPLLFLLLLVVPWLFPQLKLIEKVLLPPAQWVGERYFQLAALVAGA